VKELLMLLGSRRREWVKKLLMLLGRRRRE
jgi:hypothetical protein